MIMEAEPNWRRELAIVVDMMREVSRQSEPQAAAQLYGRKLRESGLVQGDTWMAISRRGLQRPAYRITRSWRWKTAIDPWTEPEKLPQFNSGLLSELMYTEEPVIIEDVQSRVAADDPAREYFEGMNFLFTMPQYENGEVLNMNVLMARDGNDFARERIPNMVWQSNLWGRSVHNILLKNELKVAYDALDREMQQVGNLQRSLLPSRMPEIPGLDLAAFYRTSRRAGGDYYDVFDCGDGRWGLLIADVSGHGPSAAVIMAITHAIAHLHPGTGTPPGNLLTFLNQSLLKRYTNGNGIFVTAFYGLYDPTKRTLTYARAGHNPPRFRHGGQISELDQVGALPLGMADDSVYEEKVLSLSPGDAILLYSDGITEARNPQRDEFGVEPLDAILAQGDTTAKKLVAEILSDLDAFTHSQLPVDDQTLLAIRVY
jgi:sigma-B regulation protein RsbU (phosphoserine phosphatase)